MRIVVKSALERDLIDRFRGDLEQIHRATDLQIIDILKGRHSLRLPEDVYDVVLAVVKVIADIFERGYLKIILINIFQNSSSRAVNIRSRAVQP